MTKGRNSGNKRAETRREARGLNDRQASSTKDNFAKMREENRYGWWVRHLEWAQKYNNQPAAVAAEKALQKMEG